MSQVCCHVSASMWCQVGRVLGPFTMHKFHDLVQSQCTLCLQCPIYIALYEPATVDITLIYGWCERITVLRIGLSGFRLGSSILRLGLSILCIGLSVLQMGFTHMGDTQLSDRDLMHFMH